MKTPWEIDQEYRRQGFVKIVFEVEPDEDGYPSAGLTRERLWAVPVASGYRIDGIPWFARLVACEDIVAVAQIDGELLFTTVLQPSGHSTLRVVITDKDTDPLVIRNQLRELGCESESHHVGFFAVDVPPTVRYAGVRRLLDEHEKSGILGYEESCISVEHSADR